MGAHTLVLTDRRSSHPVYTEIQTDTFSSRHPQLNQSMCFKDSFPHQKTTRMWIYFWTQHPFTWSLSCTATCSHFTFLSPGALTHKMAIIIYNASSCATVTCEGPGCNASSVTCEGPAHERHATRDGYCSARVTSTLTGSCQLTRGCIFFPIWNGQCGRS